MSIFIEVSLVIILGIVTMTYLTFETWKTKISFKEKFQKLWKDQKKQIVYSLISILCGIGLILMFHYIYPENHTITNIKLLTLVMLLFPIAWVDFKKYIIPNKLILVGILLRMPYMLIEMTLYTESFVPMVKDIFYAVIMVAIIFLLCVVIIKTGIGMGDVKLLFVMGLYQGFSGMFSAFFVTMIITFIAAIVLLISRKKDKKDKIPFAPFLLIGTAISVAITGM